MKLKTLLIIFTNMILTLPVWAEETSPPTDLYMSWAIGINSANDSDWKNADNEGTYEFKNSPIFALAIGKALNEKLRIEGEISNRKSAMTKQNYHLINGDKPFTTGAGYISAITFGANIYVNLVASEKAQTYFLSGLGTAQIEAEISLATLEYQGEQFLVHLPKDDASKLYYQIGFGQNYTLDDNLGLFIDYRRFAILGDFDIKGEKIDYSANEFRVGLRYSF